MLQGARQAVVDLVCTGISTVGICGSINDTASIHQSSEGYHSPECSGRKSSSVTPHDEAE
jgi:hypothetical protein